MLSTFRSQIYRVTIHLIAGACQRRDRGRVVLSDPDLDAQLIWQVSARSEVLLTDLRAGRPAGPALRALVGYLRGVVLTRITDEDRRLVADAHQSPGLVRALRREHLQLREDVEDLAQALADGTTPRLDGLSIVVRRLVDRLDRHLSSEAAALGGQAAGTRPADEWADAVRWYPAVEGAVIDLDDAVCEEAEDAVLRRLEQLQPGEGVELRGDGDADRLCQLLLARRTGHYTCSRRTSSDVVRVERCAED
jgi:hypothetical protein